MDQDTVETIVRIAVPALIVGMVGAVGSFLRGRRGRKRLFEELRARGATLAESQASLTVEPSHAARLMCGEIVWSAHLPRFELGFYGGASGLAAVAMTWQSSRAVGEWMLVSHATTVTDIKKLGWVEHGDQLIGLLARAFILGPPGSPPAVPNGLALALQTTLGTERNFALHSTSGRFHLVVFDARELDEPLAYWVAASGAVDRGFTAAAA